MSDSTIYTIGTALNRAHDNDIPVQVLVEGQWLTGHVVAVDGHGVVLHTDDLEHAVIRMENVAAVRILSAAPGRTPLPAGAHAMPGPRTPYER
jgi:sRNA-binding regulator protein Hfq